MKLRYADGNAACIGDKIKTFRDETVILIGMREPHKEGSTGRVTVVWLDGHQQDLFPSVINAQWKQR